MKKSSPETVIIVWGPAGSGKSSVAESLATYLNYNYIEGDNVRNGFLTVYSWQSKMQYLRL